MPIFEIQCTDCGATEEVLVLERSAAMACPSCGSLKTRKLMSATSSMTGRNGPGMPGPRDTGCCGNHPGQAEGCAGPGSCCGRR